MPPMVTVFPPAVKVAATSLFTVSVVMIAFDAAVPPSSVPERPGAMALIPAVIRSMGSCMPITPVEATRTALSGICKASAAAFAVSRQYPYPSAPVQALAIPAFTTTAWAYGEAATTS